MRQKWYCSYIDFVNESFEPLASIATLARACQCGAHRTVDTDSHHLPAGNGGSPGTAWLVRSTDAWARPMPLAVSVNQS
jgi:hypothetical protein